jgi:hypothetical protein
MPHARSDSLRCAFANQQCGSNLVHMSGNLPETALMDVDMHLSVGFFRMIAAMVSYSM